MTGLWMLTAVAYAAEAIWLKQWRPVRAPSDLAPAERMRELPLPLILEMLSVAIRQGGLHSTCADCRGRYCGRRIRCGTTVGRRTVEQRCFLG